MNAKLVSAMLHKVAATRPSVSKALAARRLVQLLDLENTRSNLITPSLLEVIPTTITIVTGCKVHE
jgi:hypothetical protein